MQIIVSTEITLVHLFLCRVEIWSICWSPLDDKVATCSEDQSTKVWQCKDWKELVHMVNYSVAINGKFFIMI